LNAADRLGDDSRMRASGDVWQITFHEKKYMENSSLVYVVVGSTVGQRLLPQVTDTLGQAYGLADYIAERRRMESEVTEERPPDQADRSRSLHALRRAKLEPVGPLDHVKTLHKCYFVFRVQVHGAKAADR
jgi:hypothetical protein